MASNLLFYHGPTGRGAYYELKLDSQLVQRASWETLAKTWTRIVPVQAGYEASAKRTIADLFFYDASAGRGDFYRIDNAGTLSALSSTLGFAKTWTHVVAVPFEFHTSILFYDGATGRGEVYRYIDKGQIVHLKSLPNLSKGWTRVVSGVFGGEFGGLLTYDAPAGRGDVYRMDVQGNLQLLRSYTSFAKTWTNIVPVPFGFRTDLLFYAADAGAAEVYRVDANGDLEQINRHLDVAKTWSHIVPVLYENHAEWAWPILYFYDATGKAGTYRIDGLGRLTMLEHRTDLAQNWTQIVPVVPALPPRRYRVRVHAVVTGNDNGPTFTADFTKADVANTILSANAVYKEAGVHLEFDPNTDVEEIKSTLLNRDFGLDANNEQTVYPVHPKTKVQILPLTPPPDELPLYPEGQARMDLGWRYRGRLVVIFRDHLGPDSQGRARSIAVGYASDRQQFIAMPKARGFSIAHELGHYLHLPHPFVEVYELAGLQETVKTWVESQPDAQTALAQGKPIPQHIIDRGLESLDSDRSFSVGSLGGATRSISDTPADAGGASGMIKAAGLNPCRDSLAFTVTFNGKLATGQQQTATYVLSPDHRNIMSYFGCAPERLSAGQVRIIRDALAHHNRAHLTAAN